MAWLTSETFGLPREKRPRTYAGRPPGGQTAEAAAHFLEQILVPDIARGSDDGGAAIVILSHELLEHGPGEFRNGLDRAGERLAERVPGPHGLREHLLGVLGRVVPVHHDLLADDLALALDLLLLEGRVQIHVGEHVAERPEVRPAGLRVIARVILGGEGVQVAAQALDLLGDGLGGPLPGPLE